jgi:hypothetical protein
MKVGTNKTKKLKTKLQDLHKKKKYFVSTLETCHPSNNRKYNVFRSKEYKKNNRTLKKGIRKCVKNYL